MASIRKIRKARTTGAPTDRWQLSWLDSAGKRHRRNFDTKGAAEEYRDAKVLRPGGRISGSRATFGDAGEDLLRLYDELVERGDRERSTLNGYRQQLAHLRADPIWRRRLIDLATSDCQGAIDRLAQRVSRDKAARVLHTMRLTFRHAIRQGWCAINPADAAALPAAARRRERSARKVEAPPLDQVRRLLEAAPAVDPTGRAEAMVSVLLFAGLRASEMIGLAREGCRLSDQQPALQVWQRVDQFGRLGPPKSPAAYRTIPIGPHCAAVLRRWLLRAPHSAFAFPRADGAHDTYRRAYETVWLPLAGKARLARRWHLDTAEGHLRLIPRFGMHALRHAAASLWIAQGVQPKQLQTWIGHDSIQTTMDIYGHLYRDADAERAHSGAIEAAIFHRR